jgi:hypothetical protein
MGIVVLAAMAGLALIPQAKGEKAPPKEDDIRVSKAAKECIDCHTAKKVGWGSIREWKLSQHALKGVGCNACHIPAEDAPDSVKNSQSKCENQNVRRSVSPKNCALCHSDKVQEFESGKHFLAWTAMMAMPTTKDQPSVIIEGEKGCGGCHRIGRDGGKCDSCHTRHRFSTAEARKPVACQTCHMGFDHPQWEMFSTSKHGTIYASEGQDWDWDQPLAQWFDDKPLEPSYKRPRAPVCASCHMPGGDHAVKTAWGFLALRLPEKDKEWEGYRNTILKGLGVLDAQGNPTERLQAVVGAQVARLKEEDWQAERDKMLNVCYNCHAPTFAKEQLDKADQVIKESDKLMAEAIETVEGLYRDGILERPKDYPLHTDLLRFYEVKYPIEEKLYTMFLEHRMRAFQGAFHFNPDYQHWYGWAEMKRDLVEIKNEAEGLRRGK